MLVGITIPLPPLLSPRCPHMKRQSTKIDKSILCIGLILLSVYIYICFNTKNYEFLYYGFLTFILIYLMWNIILGHGLSSFILLGYLILLNLNMLGGLYRIDGKRLYEYYLFLDYIRYDRLVHAFGIYLATLTFYYILRNYLYINKNLLILFGIICIGIGIGALWEIIEYIAVINFKHTGVGRYFDTMGDMIANVIGATLAMLYIKLKPSSAAQFNRDEISVSVD
jgi:uncharacterized membrane protein YjdF